MKIILLVLTLVFVFAGCSQKQPMPDVKYVYKTKVEYVYLPCKKETLFPDNDSSISQGTNVNKPIQSQKSEIKKNKITKTKTKSKFKQPKPSTIFAPKKYITRANKKMDFMIGMNKDGSEFVYMEGEFGANTDKNFLKFIKDTGTKATEVKINSNGGLVASAMQIGSFVKENNWNTGVDKEMKCMSACSFVYFAGKEKSLQGKAVVGLHRPYNPSIPDTEKNIREIKREYISYWNYIHASKSVYDEMMEVGRDDLFILDRNNITDYIDVNVE